MSNQNCEEAASDNNVGKEDSEHFVTWFINIHNFNIVQRISIKQFIFIKSYFFFDINHVGTNIIHIRDKIYT